jgi:hypothetical protein
MSSAVMTRTVAGTRLIVSRPFRAETIFRFRRSFMSSERSSSSVFSLVWGRRGEASAASAKRQMKQRIFIAGLLWDEERQDDSSTASNLSRSTTPHNAANFLPILDLLREETLIWNRTVRKTRVWGVGAS